MYLKIATKKSYKDGCNMLIQAYTHTYTYMCIYTYIFIIMQPLKMVFSKVLMAKKNANDRI